MDRGRPRRAVDESNALSRAPAGPAFERDNLSKRPSLILPDWSLSSCSIQHNFATVFFDHNGAIRHTEAVQNEP